MATYPSMAETLRGGLSLAMSGFAFWSHDISGFESTATPDLYKRWAAFGLLSSHSRLHGAGSYRVPWVFDEESSEVVKYFTNLKCTLMPYLYQLAVHAHNTGIPVMRPMILEFMDDPAVRWLDMQYMLGESLLAAPVFSADGVVDYYLPEGIWTDIGRPDRDNAVDGYINQNEEDVTADGVWQRFFWHPPYSLRKMPGRRWRL